MLQLGRSQGQHTSGSTTEKGISFWNCWQGVLDYVNEPVERRSWWKSMQRNEGSLDIQFPFLSACCEDGICTRTVRGRPDRCAGARLSSPSCWRSRFPRAVRGCSLMSPVAWDCTCTPAFELGSQRGCTGHLRSECSACVPEGAWGLCICLFAASGKVVTGTRCVCFFVVVQVGDRHLNSKRPETFVVPLLVFLLLLLSSCFISEYLIINLNFLFSPFTFPKIPPKSANCKQGN